MARFRVGYSREEYGYIYFDADNIEQAQELLDANVSDGDELPNFYDKVKSGGFEFDDEIQELTNE